jgi:NADPH:quinone reductase-like Zn-dependent oxidoreductase
MKALVPAGRPGALVSFADTHLPEPRPEEALVKVEAFSVNRGEIFQLEQPRPGTRPGKDIAGLVVQAAVRPHALRTPPDQPVARDASATKASLAS